MYLLYLYKYYKTNIKFDLTIRSVMFYNPHSINFGLQSAFYNVLFWKIKRTCFTGKATSSAIRPITKLSGFSNTCNTMTDLQLGELHSLALIQYKLYFIMFGWVSFNLRNCYLCFAWPFHTIMQCDKYSCLNHNHRSLFLECMLFSKWGQGTHRFPWEYKMS